MQRAIQRKTKLTKLRKWLGVAILSILLWFVGESTWALYSSNVAAELQRRRAAELKRIYRAISFYASENNELMPPGRAWVSSVAGAKTLPVNGLTYGGQPSSACLLELHLGKPMALGWSTPLLIDVPGRFESCTIGVIGVMSIKSDACILVLYGDGQVKCIVKQKLLAILSGNLHFGRE